MKVYELGKMGSGDWSAAARALREGGLACLPTDTVYGLACVPGVPEAMDRLYAAKKRERGKPVALMFSDLRQIRSMLPSLPQTLSGMLAALLPGPVTVILPATSEEAAALGSRAGGSIGARVVPPRFSQQFSHLPLPLALTSANPAGDCEPCAVYEVPEAILSRCEFVIDAGRSRIAEPSTVVDLRPAAAGGRPLILREGAMDRRRVENLIEGRGL